MRRLWRHIDLYGLEDWQWFVVILVGVLMFVVAVGLVVRQVSHHYAVANCDRFQQVSGHEVEFVDYTFWTWDCLALTPSGQWLPVDQLRDFGVTR